MCLGGIVTPLSRLRRAGGAADLATQSLHEFCVGDAVSMHGQRYEPCGGTERTQVSNGETRGTRAADGRDPDSKPERGGCRMVCCNDGQSNSKEIGISDELRSVYES